MDVSIVVNREERRKAEGKEVEKENERRVDVTRNEKSLKNP